MKYCCFIFFLLLPYLETEEKISKLYELILKIMNKADVPGVLRWVTDNVSYELLLLPNSVTRNSIRMKSNIQPKSVEFSVHGNVSLLINGESSIQLAPRLNGYQADLLITRKGKLAHFKLMFHFYNP